MSSFVAVDIGNSSVKVALFGSSEHPSTGQPKQLPQPLACWEGRTDNFPGDDLAQWLPAESVAWQVVSVQRAADERLQQWLTSHRPLDTFRLLGYQDLPLAVRVKFPERVGVDRLVAAVAANHLREAHRSAIVVDAGSAITVDLVAPDGSFQGGAIYPGFRLSAQALFQGADLLPLADIQPLGTPPEPLGKETTEAIRSGLFWGGVGAVRELVARLTDTAIGDFGEFPPHIFITGGDLRQLALFIPESLFVPNMVLAGIALVTPQ